MHSINTIPYALCHELLSYDATTGHLTWKVRLPNTHHNKSFNTRYAGKVAGFDNGTGYLCVGIMGKMLLAHRVAWTMHYGKQPAMDLDHRDRDRMNNSIRNLREVTKGENMANRGISKRRMDAGLPIGITVREDSRVRPYLARLQVRGDLVLHQQYATLEEATLAYRETFKGFHGHYPA